jgi:hypothetical protein
MVSRIPENKPSMMDLGGTTQTTFVVEMIIYSPNRYPHEFIE